MKKLTKPCSACRLIALLLLALWLTACASSMPPLPVVNLAPQIPPPPAALMQPEPPAATLVQIPGQESPESVQQLLLRWNSEFTAWWTKKEACRLMPQTCA